MRTINLSGFKPGDSLSISVSQGALTAGPINVPSWEGGGAGGNIAINVDRSTLECAPESIRLSVDLSAATFDTEGPTGSEVYDARMHDLIYLWDFDDTAGDWSAPVNVLPAWKNRSVAKGPFVVHMYTQPGTYNPSVLVVEPSSGKTATATLSGVDAITVLDPDDVYPDANSYYINEIGDSDFSAVPAGVSAGNKINTDAMRDTTFSDIANSGTGPVRIRYKAGSEFEMAVQVTSATRRGIFFDRYGTGANPILNVSTDGAIDGLDVIFQTWSGYGNGVSTDVRFRGLALQGTFDPTTTISSGVTNRGIAFRTLESVNFMVSDCSMDGFSAGLSAYPSTWSRQANYHFDDFVVTNYGGQYQFITSKNGMANLNASFAMTGSRVEQAHDAIDDGTVRAPIRLNDMPRTHLRGNDMFAMDASQPVLKMVETPSTDGHIVNIHSCALEGGIWPLSFQNNNFADGAMRSTCMNAVVDGIIIVGAFRTQYMVKVQGTGLTLRNCLMIQPNMIKFNNRLVGFVLVSESGTYDADLVGAAPVQVYNCTFRSDRTYVNNNSQSTIVVDNVSSFSAVSFDNNILHMPLMTPVEDSFAPLTSATLWTPRCLGRRDPTTLVLDTQYATPTDAVKASIPDTGSAAIDGSTSGSRALYDLYGTKRVDGYTIGTVDAGYAET